MKHLEYFEKYNSNNIIKKAIAGVELTDTELATIKRLGNVVSGWNGKPLEISSSSVIVFINNRNQIAATKLDASYRQAKELYDYSFLDVDYRREAVCPVCGKVVSGNDYLSSSFFNRESSGHVSYRCSCGWHYLFEAIDVSIKTDGDVVESEWWEYPAAETEQEKDMWDLPKYRFFESRTARPVFVTEEKIWQLRNASEMSAYEAKLAEYERDCLKTHYKAVFRLLTDDQLLYLAGIGASGKGSTAKGKAVRKAIKKVAFSTWPGQGYYDMEDKILGTLRKACEEKAK